MTTNITSKHLIYIESFSRFGELEWREIVSGGNKAVATRKANAIVRDCGHTGPVAKTTNWMDSSIESWTLDTPSQR